MQGRAFGGGVGVSNGRPACYHRGEDRRPGDGLGGAYTYDSEGHILSASGVNYTYDPLANRVSYFMSGSPLSGTVNTLALSAARTACASRAYSTAFR